MRFRYIVARTEEEAWEKLARGEVCRLYASAKDEQRRLNSLHLTKDEHFNEYFVMRVRLELA